MFTVKVLKSNTGLPVQSAKVSVHFSGITRGISKDYYTDSNGEAHLTEDIGKGKIYVNSELKHEGNIEGRILIYM